MMMGVCIIFQISFGSHTCVIWGTHHKKQQQAFTFLKCSAIS